MKVTTTAEMRALDRAAIQLGIPSLVLMERAALGCVEALATHFPDARTVQVVAGPGNNGGDGLAIARILRDRGYQVQVMRLGSPFSPENQIQAAILEGLGVRILPFQASLPAADVAVDALFGVGLTRPLQGEFQAACDWLNQHDNLIAVDLPSGIDSDSGMPLGAAVQASLTVTLGLPKRGLLTDAALSFTGDVEVVEIGIPHGLDQAITSQIVPPLMMPARRQASHKGDFGRLLVVAGSDKMPGAAHWAVQGALQLGPGLVMTLGAPPVPDAVGVEHLGERSPTAVALGPGLGLGERAKQLLCEALAWSGPLLIDADGLNLLAAHPELWQARPQTVMTPHPAELGRLMGVSAEEIQSDRWGWAERAAERFGCVVVLKGAYGLVAEPGRTWVNVTGSPALARGGSGDVLSGLIGALLAQGFDPFDAASGGSWLFGRAGELAADAWGEVPATLPRIVEAICDAL